MLNDQLAGLSLLGISDIKERKGYTGADTFLGFQILRLEQDRNRLPDNEHRLEKIDRENSGLSV